MSRWRGARGDRGAARRRSARASRAGAAARGSGCGGAAREARASQNRTDRSCCSFCSSATRSSATSVATHTPDISRSVHVHSCRSSARLRARAAAAARLGCTAWPPARHRRRPHGLWRRRRSVPPRHMIHSGRVGRPNRRGAARVDLQRPHRPGCSSHRRGGNGRPPRADRPTADLMSAGVVHGPAGCNSAAPEERGLAHRASPEASSPLTSQRRSSTEDMHVIAGMVHSKCRKRSHEALASKVVTTRLSVVQLLRTRCAWGRRRRRTGRRQRPRQGVGAPAWQ